METPQRSTQKINRNNHQLHQWKLAASLWKNREATKTIWRHLFLKKELWKHYICFFSSLIFYLLFWGLTYFSRLFIYLYRHTSYSTLVWNSLLLRGTIYADDSISSSYWWSVYPPKDYYDDRFLPIFAVVSV